MRIACGGTTRARVLPEHEVGDGPDRWVPPVGVLGAWVRSVSGCSKGEGAACWAALRWPRTGPRGEERKEGENRPRGKKRNWAEPESVEGENKTFSFLFPHLLLNSF